MKVRDASADLLGNLSRETFAKRGRGRWTAALVYRALSLDPLHPAAIATLGGFLDDAVGGSLPADFTLLSALVLEYALSDECAIAAVEKRRLEAEQFLTLWAWRFSRHVSRSTELASADFLDRTKFHVDWARYHAWRAPALATAGGLRQAFAIGHAAMGYLAGFLKIRAGTKPETVCAAYRPEDLHVDHAAYDAWLDLDLETLTRAGG